MKNISYPRKLIYQTLYMHVKKYFITIMQILFSYLDRVVVLLLIFIDDAVIKYRFSFTISSSRIRNKNVVLYFLENRERRVI